MGDTVLEWKLFYSVLRNHWKGFPTAFISASPVPKLLFFVWITF